MVTAVVADGLSSGTHSEHAARLAAETVLTELTRADRRARNAEQAHQLAATTAAARVAALAMPGQVFPPATTYVAVQVIPTPGKASVARIVVSHLGDARAFLLPDPGTGGRPRILTEDHTSTAGALTAFLGENPRSMPTVKSYYPRRPGDLLLATDGLHAHFTLDGLAGTAGGTALDRVERLVAAVRARPAGGADNRTAVVIRLA